MSNINYAHIRPSSDSRSGGLTIAYTNLEKGSTGEVTYAIARCSPKDNFSRRLGRRIAEGRLDKGMSDKVYSNSSKYADIVQAILDDINYESGHGREV